MEKFHGNKKLTVSVFISGRGSNLKSLIDFSKSKNSPIKIDLVVCNNKNAKGLKYSKKNKIKFLIINYDNKKKAENKILSSLKKNNINLICLAGYMKILSKKIINNYKGRILNIHPSLLPKYKGLNTHKRALDNHEKYSGCTVHFVNARLDSGKIILQKKVKISNNETKNSLAKKILKQEHKLYPKAILKVFSL